MPTTSDNRTNPPSDETLATSKPLVAEPFHTGRVVTLSLAHGVHDIYAAFLAPLLPSLIAKLSLSMTQAGLLDFVRSAPSLLQPFIGHVADRASLRYVVILTPAVTATTMSLLGVAPGYATLLLLVLIAGLSSAALHAVAPAMAGRFSGPRLGRGMGVWMVGGSIGFALGPILVVTVVNFLGLEGTPWLMIIGWVASGVLYVRLRDIPQPTPPARHAGSLRDGFQILRPLLAPLTGIIVVRALLVAAQITFLPTFLVQEGADLWFAGFSLTLLTGAGWLGALLGGSISDRVGRRLVIFVSMVTSALLMLAFIAISGWMRVPILMLMGVMGPSVRTALMALVQENCPENRALANGLYLALSFTLESVAAVVMGAMGDLLGLRPAFAISAVILLLGSPLVRLLPGRYSPSHQTPDGQKPSGTGSEGICL